MYRLRLVAPSDKGVSSKNHINTSDLSIRFSSLHYMSADCLSLHFLPFTSRLPPLFSFVSHFSSLKDGRSQIKVHKESPTNGHKFTALGLHPSMSTSVSTWMDDRQGRPSTMNRVRSLVWTVISSATVYRPIAVIVLTRT